MPGRFSPFVIKALVETITGGGGNDQTEPIGIYRSGARIENFFQSCGLDMRIGVSSRVPATNEFLRRTADAADGDKLIERVLLNVCDPREYGTDANQAVAVREHLNRALGPDGLCVTVVGGRAHLVVRGAKGLIVNSFVTKVATLDFDTVQAEIARALASADDDPEDAVTAACSLLEAVCRSILQELKMPLPPKKDIDGLIRAVQKPLGISPQRTDLPLRSNKIFGRFLEVSLLRLKELALCERMPGMRMGVKRDFVELTHV